MLCHIRKADTRPRQWLGTGLKLERRRALSKRGGRLPIDGRQGHQPSRQRGMAEAIRGLAKAGRRPGFAGKPQQSPTTTRLFGLLSPETRRGVAEMTRGAAKLLCARRIQAHPISSVARYKARSILLFQHYAADRKMRPCRFLIFSFKKMLCTCNFTVPALRLSS